MSRIVIAEGDGIGKEVIPVARRVLETVRPDLEFIPVEVGYGRWERTGEAITSAEIRAMKEADAVLFGAVTTPPDPEYRSVVVRMRKELDLYANVRPVRGGDADIVIVRENSEGLYSGIEEVGPDRATTVRLVTRRGSGRIARFACAIAKGRRHLTIGHKANVLKSDTLFREVCIGIARETGVPFREKFIDALCLDVLQHPGEYDVIVTENMFGDILSDVAAFLVGGLGMLPSGNIGDRSALFEPVHGSAPKHAGRNTANPIAAIRSGAMLLAHIGDQENATRIEEAIGQVLASGMGTRDIGGTAGTREMGDAIIAALKP